MARCVVEVVEVVEALDLSGVARAYAGKGSEAYHPARLMSLLIYGYATGTFSSRKNVAQFIQLTADHAGEYPGERAGQHLEKLQ